MEDLLHRLNELTPVIAVVSLALFMTLDRWLPYFDRFRGPREQTVWEMLKMPFRSV